MHVRRSFVLAFALACLTGGIRAQAPIDPVQVLAGAQARLDTETVTCSRLHIAAKDAAAPLPLLHDTVFVVLAGAGKLDANGVQRAVTAGDVVYVRAGTPHRFVDISNDLDLVVTRPSTRPTTGGMAGQPEPTKQTAYPEGSERGCARIFYWCGPDSAGQVAIDHGQPRWQPSFERFLAQPSGRRWRLGENFWTTLDTNIALTIAGVDVPVGQYYAVLVNDLKDGLHLVLLDPQAVRKQRLDAFEANKTTGGIQVPLQHAAASEVSDRLRIELEVDRAHDDHAALKIRFGPHELSAPLVLHPVHD